MRSATALASPRDLSAGRDPGMNAIMAQLARMGSGKAEVIE